MSKFECFPKIARLYRDITITEKLDGTNASILIENGEISGVFSRTREIMPGKATDNFGFAGWVKDNAESLLELGEGRHFGEWYGNGINRGYDLPSKRFALFNSARWADERPAVCDVVPIIAQHTFSEAAIDSALAQLVNEGSLASPGFMDPEGIVIYHRQSNQMFKVTLKNDGIPKSVAS